MGQRFTAPPTGHPSPFVLLTASEQSMGRPDLAQARVAASSVWSASNTAQFYPFVIKQPRTYLGMIWMNGAAVSGNVNAAVYSADLTTALATIGSVAQAGTTAPQKKAFGSPLTLQPGVYFMALVLDNTTGTIVGNTMSAVIERTGGARQLAAFFALTASAAAAVGLASSRLPYFGLYEASWL
jgi:hypothetical protein